ncbi:MAG TPA: sigma-70 family RNA polymerase sigma factor [bacterium]|nr:sigma-70 family RNA polymerase sigma factor [bacterium]
MALDRDSKSKKPFGYSSEENRLQWESWQSLMALTQSGDLQAYRRLLEEIGPLLLGYVRKRVYDPDQVMDAYQDLLLTLHKALPTYDPKRPLGPWLFTVARNSLLVSLGRKRRILEREVQVEKLQDRAQAPAAEESEGLGDELYRALRGLPKMNRQAVELLKIQGLSLEEASRRLGISVPALKVRAHRGYEYLRKSLGEVRKK